MRECQKTDLGEYQGGLNAQWRKAGIYGKEICYRLKKKKCISSKIRLCFGFSEGERLVWGLLRFRSGVLLYSPPGLSCPPTVLLPREPLGSLYLVAPHSFSCLSDFSWGWKQCEHPL